jgi:catechol 2,3-dioxygenase-like lactoylglutathione lyase family enzyme
MASKTVYSGGESAGHVDNLDALLSKIQAKGVVVVKRDDSDPNAQFAWVLDPDGNKLELWEPK